MNRMSKLLEQEVVVIVVVAAAKKFKYQSYNLSLEIKPVIRTNLVNIQGPIRRVADKEAILPYGNAVCSWERTSHFLTVNYLLMLSASVTTKKSRRVE